MPGRGIGREAIDLGALNRDVEGEEVTQGEEVTLNVGHYGSKHSGIKGACRPGLSVKR